MAKKAQTVAEIESELIAARAKLADLRKTAPADADAARFRKNYAHYVERLEAYFVQQEYAAR